jgi:hypothetical protein
VKSELAIVAKRLVRPIRKFQRGLPQRLHVASQGDRHVGDTTRFGWGTRGAARARKRLPFPSAGRQKGGRHGKKERQCRGQP